MRLIIALTLYQLLLPLLFLAAFPGWLVKMLRRGGLATRLGERIAVYSRPLALEPRGAVHFHAVSVGESMLALKLIREWQLTEPERPFVLATGTATGHAVATAAGIPRLRVTYSPLDFRWLVRRYLQRFKPSQIVLIEGEVWPHLLLACARHKIPVRLVDARMSPRSARRFAKFANWLSPIYRLLDTVTLPQQDEAPRWQELGIAREKIHVTGSLKFDPSSGRHPTPRREFQEMIDHFGKQRPVILAASTFPGEEVFIAQAIRAAAPEALAIIVPRHAERRSEVKTDLTAAGFKVVLRSNFTPPQPHSVSAFLIDSTGELRDWTAHATVVIIGKSFLSSGGQNPCEAILAGKPVICGPHMENFQPLARHLIDNGGCLLAHDREQLTQAIVTALKPAQAAELTHAASHLLARHHGATRRILALLQP